MRKFFTFLQLKKWEQDRSYGNFLVINCLRLCLKLEKYCILLKLHLSMYFILTYIFFFLVDNLKKIMIDIADRYKTVKAGNVDRPPKPFSLQQADLSVIHAETELMTRR